MWRRAWVRFRRNTAAVAAAVLLVLVLAGAVCAPVITPYDPKVGDLRQAFRPPSREHPLGTDELGRDLLARLLFGARVSLSIGLVSLGISLGAGTVLGLVAGYRGGLWDSGLMRLMDVLMAFPPLLLAVGIVAALGPGLYNAMVAVGVVQIPVFARLVRGQVLSLREQDFVQSARSTGASDLRIALVHILPSCLSPLVVQSTFVFATAILSAAALGFLGLGAQPPSPEWGAMLSKARDYLQVAPHLSVYPGLAILVTVLLLNLVGDGLRDALDPKMEIVAAAFARRGKRRAGVDGRVGATVAGRGGRSVHR